MKPTARRDAATVEVQSDRTLIHLGGRTHQLPADVGAVWSCLDGLRSPAEIAAHLGWAEPGGTRRVWTALDRLGDLNLLEQRTAPPATTLPTVGQSGLSRREVLQRIAAGVAGGLAVAVAARTSFAQDARVREDTQKSADRLRAAEEEAAKEVQRLTATAQEQEEKVTEAVACDKRRAGAREQDAKAIQCRDLKLVREEAEKAQVRLGAARKEEAHRKAVRLNEEKAKAK